MLQRTSFIKPKPVLIINDIPVKVEIEKNESFSSASNRHLFTSLRTGRIHHNNSNPVVGHRGINLLDCNYTYLDYSYFGEIEKNFDYFKEIKKGKDLQRIEKPSIENGIFYIPKDEEDTSPEDEIPDNTFVKLETHKDVWISKRLNNSLRDLLDFIKKSNPKLIIVTGKWGLFFLTGLPSLSDTIGTKVTKKPLGGLVKYRASILSLHETHKLNFDIPDHVLIPIIHPVNSNNMTDFAPVMELDCRRVARVFHTIQEKGIEYYKVPPKEVFIGDTFEKAVDFCKNILSKLEEGPTLLSVDVETMHKSYIDCIGIGYNTSFSFVIPFATAETPLYWSLEEEQELTRLVKEILEHTNTRHIGQNYQYDCQYFYHNWGIVAHAYHDTMILHHCLYNYLPKDLAFLASLYVEHYTYWKDEIDASKEAPETRWKYNGKDIFYTLEVLQVLLGILENEKDTRLKDLYEFQVRKLGVEATKTMNRGVRIDIEQKEELYKFFLGVNDLIRVRINEILGFEINLNSTQQKKKLFKEFLGITLKVKKRKGAESSETLDSAAMVEYIEEYPEYAPLLTLMLEQTAIAKFTKTFLGAKLDDDGRMRTQYRIAGTNTGRLASTKNVFGRGANLQNIPVKGKLPLHYTLEVLNKKDTGPTEEDMENWKDFLNSVVEMEEEDETSV